MTGEVTNVRCVAKVSKSSPNYAAMPICLLHNYTRNQRLSTPICSFDYKVQQVDGARSDFSCCR